MKVISLNQTTMGPVFFVGSKWNTLPYLPNYLTDFHDTMSETLNPLYQKQCSEAQE